MRTYNITDVIYEELVERCSDNATFGWDCIELEDGYALVFASKNGNPCNVEVRNENDEVISHDFSIASFNKVRLS